MSRQWKVGGTKSNERKLSRTLDHCYMRNEVNDPRDLKL